MKKIIRIYIIILKPINTISEQIQNITNKTQKNIFLIQNISFIQLF